MIKLRMNAAPRGALHRLSKKVSLRDDYNGALPHTPPKGYYPFGIPFM